MTSDELPKHRPIRSFVLREGRLTTGQKRALELHWPKYGLTLKPSPSTANHLDTATIFGRTVPLVFEIGFGNGESLANMALANPEYDFIGVEVHRPGVGHLLHLIDEHNISNIRVFCEDAVEVLTQAISPQSLAIVQLFFPDPWHKKRHHKRRLIQPAFMALLHSRLQTGGLLHVATDWEDYAAHVKTVLADIDNFIAADIRQCLQRPSTKFEQRGQRLGHGVWDLTFKSL